MSKVAVFTEQELEAFAERVASAAVAKVQPLPEVLRTADAAKLIGVCTKTLLRMARDDGLPHHLIAKGDFRFIRSELLSWLASQGREVA